MSSLPLRIRVTLVFALAMALVLAGVGWFVYAQVSSDLNRSLDRELRSRSQDLSALVLRDGSLGRIRPRADVFAQLVGVEGQVLDSTEPVGEFRLLTPGALAEARERPTFVDRRSVPSLDEEARLLAVPLEGRVLVVGASKESMNETLSSLSAAFLVGGPIALLLACAAGYLLAGAALRPIEAMRRRAAEISTSSLDERLPVPAANDEVARLGATLNVMLARLEDGVARERRFVADASHELRTPLAMLKAELELALRRARSPEELERSIRSAATETERLARIADDLLLLARAEQGRLEIKAEPTDIVDVLRAVTSRFRARAESESRSLVVDADGAPVASIDRLRLEQALGNLVDNALRHGGGAITVSAEARDSSLELHVRDEGPGFPAAFRAQAFERFTRAAEPGAEGSGLGLAIVETIAKAHGGRVTAGNTALGGADISISLPL
jgi:heavy metal sensor kinase